jgi:hypothetical protein
MGIAASRNDPVALGVGTKVANINQTLMDDGTLPQGFSLNFPSRNQMFVRNAAGYGGEDAQAWGHVPSIVVKPAGPSGYSNTWLKDWTERYLLGLMDASPEIWITYGVSCVTRWRKQTTSFSTRVR